jgi:hypothetical protein
VLRYFICHFDDDDIRNNVYLKFLYIIFGVVNSDSRPASN